MRMMTRVLLVVVVLVVCPTTTQSNKVPTEKNQTKSGWCNKIPSSLRFEELLLMVAAPSF